MTSSATRGVDPPPLSDHPDSRRRTYRPAIPPLRLSSEVRSVTDLTLATDSRDRHQHANRVRSVIKGLSRIKVGKALALQPPHHLGHSIDPACARAVQSGGLFQVNGRALWGCEWKIPRGVDERRRRTIATRNRWSRLPSSVGPSRCPTHQCSTARHRFAASTSGAFQHWSPDPWSTSRIGAAVDHQSSV